MLSDVESIALRPFNIGVLTPWRGRRRICARVSVSYGAKTGPRRWIFRALDGRSARSNLHALASRVLPYI